MTANCKNCGAPTDGLRCEYCGTPNDAMMNVPVGKPVKVSLDVGDTVYEFEMVVGQFDMDYEYDNHMYYSVDEPVLRRSMYVGARVMMGGDMIGNLVMREKKGERRKNLAMSSKSNAR